MDEARKGGRPKGSVAKRNALGRARLAPLVRKEIAECSDGQIYLGNRFMIEFLIDCVFRTVKKQLMLGNSITVAGLGSLRVSYYGARVFKDTLSRNRGEPIHWPKQRFVYFHQSKKFKDQLNGRRSVED